MLNTDTLRQLADLAAPERAFLTVYLDDGDDRSVLDSRWERIRSLLADQPEETQHFEESLGLAEALLVANSPPTGGALAVYCSWGADLGTAFELPAPVGTMAWMGAAPYVRPAYELLDEHETFAVAVVDNTRAKIYVVTASDVEEEASVRGDVKNSVKKGGWSQKRYARRREKELSRYAQDIADALADVDAASPFARLVLLGSEETIQSVQQALRTDLADKVVGAEAASTADSEAELVEQAAALADQGERAEERALWDEIREQGLSGTLSSFGATDVLETVHAARAEALLVDREAEFAGTKCRACEHVLHGATDTCGQCGSSDVFHTDLVEHLTQEAMRTGATVDFADPFPALTQAGGVAALLRY